MKQKIKLNINLLLTIGLSVLIMGVGSVLTANTVEAATQTAQYNHDGEFTEMMPGAFQSYVTEDADNFTDTYNNVTNTHSGTINFAFSMNNGMSEICSQAVTYKRIKSFRIYDTSNNVIYDKTVNASYNLATNLKTSSWSNVSGGEISKVEVTYFFRSSFPINSYPSCTITSSFESTSTNVVVKTPPVINPPSGPVTVVGTAKLAIYDTPTVSLQVDGSASVTLTQGQSASFAWTTHATNIDNSCTATNNASDGSWTGLKNGLGGTQNMGPFNNPGNFTYSIQCTGALGSVSPISSVTVNVNPLPPPSFTLNCTPATASITAGSSTSYIVTINSVNGFNSQVSLSGVVSGGGALPKGKTLPSVSFSPNPSLPGTVTALVTTNASTTPNGTYTITITGSSAGFTDQACGVQLIVTATVPPNPPTNVSVSNTQCGVIDISWRNSTGTPTPTTYRIYRRTSTSNPWQQLGTDIPYVSGSTYTYTVRDNSPLNIGGSNYYAVTAVASSIESTYANASPSPVVPVACEPNITSSDKDVISVSGRINQTFSPIVCSGTSEIAALPNGALFAPGDSITFQINVCNTGTEALTNVQVTDTYTNLSGLAVVPGGKGSCVTDSSVTANSVIITMADIAPTNGICSVRLTGIVTAPPNPTAAIYRFQNHALITADGGISRNVYTPPYLFSITGGVPDRGETAPQQTGSGGSGAGPGGR